MRNRHLRDLYVAVMVEKPYRQFHAVAVVRCRVLDGIQRISALRRLLHGVKRRLFGRFRIRSRRKKQHAALHVRRNQVSHPCTHRLFGKFRRVRRSVRREYQRTLRRIRLVADRKGHML